MISVPTAPSIIKGIITSAQSAIISWSKPTNARGRLTHYTVHWIIQGRNRIRSKKVDSSHQHVRIKDLPSEIITVWVTASTSVGRSENSRNITLKTTTTIPAAVWSIGGNVTATWREDLTLPCHSVGMPKPNKLWRMNGMLVKEAAVKR